MASAPAESISFPFCKLFFPLLLQELTTSNQYIPSFTQFIMAGPCWTCRKRTIQCDLSGMPCAKCQKAGLECFETRPLRWVKGMAIRGKMRGITLENNQNCQNKNFHRISKQKRTSEENRQTLETCRVRPSFSLEDPSIQTLNASSRFYLDYCRFILLISQSYTNLVMSQHSSLQVIHSPRQRQ